MIKLNSQGIPLEPVTRTELFAEIRRLQTLAAEAVRTINKFAPAEADALKLALLRGPAQGND